MNPNLILNTRFPGLGTSRPRTGEDYAKIYKNMARVVPAQIPWNHED